MSHSEVYITFNFQVKRLLFYDSLNLATRTHTFLYIFDLKWKNVRIFVVYSRRQCDIVQIDNNCVYFREQKRRSFLNGKHKTLYFIVFNCSQIKLKFRTTVFGCLDTFISRKTNCSRTLSPSKQPLFVNVCYSGNITKIQRFIAVSRQYDIL